MTSLIINSVHNYTVALSKIREIYEKNGLNESSSKSDKFYAVLLASSPISEEGRSLDSILEEYKVIGEKQHRFNTQKHCICSSIIKNEFFVQNKLNDNTLIIGDCCVKKFEANSEDDKVDKEFDPDKESDVEEKDDFSEEAKQTLEDLIREAEYITNKGRKRNGV